MTRRTRGKSSKVTMPPMVGRADFLCGGRKLCFQHPGTQFVRQSLVTASLKRYLDGDRATKEQIRSEVVLQVFARQGRFLEIDPKQLDGWVQLSFVEARHRVGLLFWNLAKTERRLGTSSTKARKKKKKVQPSIKEVEEKEEPPAAFREVECSLDGLISRSVSWEDDWFASWDEDDFAAEENNPFKTDGNRSGDSHDDNAALDNTLLEDIPFPLSSSSQHDAVLDPLQCQSLEQWLEGNGMIQVDRKQHEKDLTHTPRKQERQDQRISLSQWLEKEKPATMESRTNANNSVGVSSCSSTMKSNRSLRRREEDPIEPKFSPKSPHRRSSPIPHERTSASIDSSSSINSSSSTSKGASSKSSRDKRSKQGSNKSSSNSSKGKHNRNSSTGSTTTATTATSSCSSLYAMLSETSSPKSPSSVASHGMIQEETEEDDEFILLTPNPSHSKDDRDDKFKTWSELANEEKVFGGSNRSSPRGVVW